MIRPTVVLWALVIACTVTTAFCLVAVGILANRGNMQADQIEELQAEVSELHAAMHGKVRTFITATR